MLNFVLSELHVPQRNMNDIAEPQFIKRDQDVPDTVIWPTELLLSKSYKRATRGANDDIYGYISRSRVLETGSALCNLSREVVGL